MERLPGRQTEVLSTQIVAERVAERIREEVKRLTRRILRISTASTVTSVGGTLFLLGAGEFIPPVKEFFTNTPRDQVAILLLIPTIASTLLIDHYLTGRYINRISFLRSSNNQR